MDTSIIKQSVTLSQACQMYGVPINHQGFSRCPFHSGDNTASFKIYPDDRGFYCFGCGLGGDVIKFVMLLFNINFAQAVQRLNNDFRLGLSDYTEDNAEVLRRRRERSERILAIHQLENKLRGLCKLHRIYHNILKDYHGGEPNRLESEAIYKINYVQYEIEVNEELLCRMKSQL